MNQNEKQTDMSAKFDLQQGNKYPFDAPDKFWSDEDTAPPPPTDWAHAAARGVIYNLQDRRGIKNELHPYIIDEEVRVEIIATLAKIIREASPGNDQDEARRQLLP